MGESIGRTWPSWRRPARTRLLPGLQSFILPTSWPQRVNCARWRRGHSARRRKTTFYCDDFNKEVMAAIHIRTRKFLLIVLAIFASTFISGVALAQKPKVTKVKPKP